MAIVPGEIVAEFGKHFATEARPTVFRAPGRVNLIGEHTDYNLGFVFPIAIDLACFIAMAPADHGQLRIYSRDTGAGFQIAVGEIGEAQPQKSWSDYVVGVARGLSAAGIEIGSANLYVAGDVPAGSGLSSSAALEIASAFALLGTREMPPLDIALLGQRAEIEFVGMPCGVMDQYASVFGKEGAAIQLDCRSLKHEYVPLPEDVDIIAVNSLVKHELGTSAYRDRVAECQTAVAAIQKVRPEVKSLRDVSLTTFEQIQDSIPLLPRRRARHIITDSQRVLDLAGAARQRDLREMGRLFVASQRSMQYDYEITCEEIDFLVDRAIELPGVYGSRMTGGGFGGCTVNLVKPGLSQEFRSRITKAYEDRFQITPVFYDCKPGPGASRVNT